MSDDTKYGPILDPDPIDEELDYQKVIDAIIRDKGWKWYDKAVEDAGVDEHDTRGIAESLIAALNAERKPGKPRLQTDEDLDELPYVEHEINYRLAVSYEESNSIRTPAVIIEAVYRYSSLLEYEDIPSKNVVNAIFEHAKETIEKYYRTDLDTIEWNFVEGMEKPTPTGQRYAALTELELIKSALKWESRYEGSVKKFSETINVIGSGPDESAFSTRGTGRTKKIIPVRERGETTFKGEPM